MTKTFTCRFILKDNVEYKDLTPVFPDIMRYILKENEHFQNAEEEEMREMYVELNMQDVVENRKPEGYDRKAKYRLIFPIGQKEFYVKQFAQKNNDIKRIATTISDFLSTANIGYELKFDYTVECIPGSEGKFTLVDHNSEVQFPAVYEFGKTLHANFKFKNKLKKNDRFGYVINGQFHEITVTGTNVSMDFEICNDIAFGFE